MSIDILVIGLPALADDMLTHQAPDRGWTLHRPGPDGLPRPETAGRILAIAASGAVSVDARLIDALPALKIISVHAVGYDLTDVAHARSRGVVVTHTPRCAERRRGGFGPAAGAGGRCADCPPWTPMSALDAGRRRDRRPCRAALQA